ncbi:MAG: SDR family oxidoreductase [Gemmatimonadetes bacterium]|nr:SDR family oxidoreductase [Gemmatimonadota bacterium]NIT87512.1 SDR family oxidoreductase [Gemmatimonadota bacterium]NIU32558.1 SDR family oxidoreductase [Gemmatimonadota bacterium]NIV61733.1 SDR family oxidoreductase [Gemmatimonadota bacterium]NIW65655.1 SDR family oxidoreductase [Gemmatimonadota bacterium]
MDLGLSRKVALVGGASRGLGYAVARSLVAEGASVSMASRDEEEIRSAAGKIGSDTGAEVIGVAADLTSKREIEEWVSATIDRFGGIDLLFTNTGGPPAGGFYDVDDEAWEDAFRLLVLSVIRLVRLAAPEMKRRGGGSILMSTSSSVKEPIPNLTLSNVLRPGVAALAKQLSSELADDGIRVNQIIPGRIATDRVASLDEINAERAGISVDDQRAKSLAGIPARRYGEPGEFGRAAAFLLSSAASYVTGATLQVDGGRIRSVM